MKCDVIATQIRTTEPIYNCVVIIRKTTRNNNTDGVEKWKMKFVDEVTKDVDDDDDDGDDP